MKLSLVISSPQTKFSAVAKIGDWEKSIRRVSQLGFKAVELAVRNPEAEVQEKIIREISALSLSVSAIGTGQAYLEDGLSLTHPEKKVRQLTINRLFKFIDLAKATGAKVIIGLIRGRIEGEDKRWKFLRDGIKSSADYATKQQVELLIEPINRYEIDNLNNISQTIDFIKGLKSDNIGILADTFHMNIEEENLVESLRRSGKLLRHIHLADSNRLYLGAGHINFVEIFSLLRKMKFNEYLSLEIIPQPDIETAAKLSLQFIKRVEFKIKSPKKRDYPQPSLTVDLVIEEKEGVVLIRRLNPPFAGKWALPGGFVEYGETVEEAALREAAEEVGVKVKLTELIGVYSDPERDPRGHTVSVVFRARPYKGRLKASSDAKEVAVKKIEEIKEEELAFDHKKIIKDALKLRKNG